MQFFQTLLTAHNQFPLIGIFLFFCVYVVGTGVPADLSYPINPVFSCYFCLWPRMVLTDGFLGGS
jgi:hypothetical protein